MLNQSDKRLLIALGVVITVAYLGQQFFPAPIIIPKSTQQKTEVTTPLQTKKASLVYQAIPVSIERPTQVNLKTPVIFKFKNYQLNAAAQYRVKAVVLGKKDYWLGEEVNLSPTDLALGWGPMADKKNYSRVDITQDGRWYYWQVNQIFMPLEKIAQNSANTHIIPSNPSVKNLLGKIQKGYTVDLQGYLVNITKNDGSGWHWQSSMTREDTGNGACEIFYVTQVHQILR